jgi:hypothetical protein
MTVPRSQRFSAVHPCPACGRGKHNSWCYILTGGAAFWCGRASHFAGRPGLPRKSGWVHRLSTTAAPVAYVRPMAPASADRSAFPALARRLACSPGQLEHLAAKLHLHPEAVARFKPCWADAVPDPRPDDPYRHVIQGTATPCRTHGVWLFPMYRPATPPHPAPPHPRPVICGFRVRTLGGDKYSITGTDGDGLFIPTGVTLCRGGLLLAPEGPTSAAALCQLGFCAIGRPNNRAGIQYLRALIRWLRPARVIVFGDNDERAVERTNPTTGLAEWPGLDGATSTAASLHGLRCAVSIALPPPGIKDARQWVIQGAGVRDVHQQISGQTYHLTHHRPEGACA